MQYYYGQQADAPFKVYKKTEKYFGILFFPAKVDSEKKYKYFFKKYTRFGEGGGQKSTFFTFPDI